MLGKTILLFLMIAVIGVYSAPTVEVTCRVLTGYYVGFAIPAQPICFIVLPDENYSYYKTEDTHLGEFHVYNDVCTKLPGKILFDQENNEFHMGYRIYSEGDTIPNCSIGERGSIITGIATKDRKIYLQIHIGESEPEKEIEEEIEKNTTTTTTNATTTTTTATTIGSKIEKVAYMVTESSNDGLKRQFVTEAVHVIFNWFFPFAIGVLLAVFVFTAVSMRGKNGKRQQSKEVNSHGYELPILAQNDSPPADKTTVAHDSVHTDFHNLEDGRVSMTCEVNSHRYQLPLHNQQNPLAQNVVDSYHNDVVKASPIPFDPAHADFSDLNDNDSPNADNTTVAHDSVPTDYQNLEDGRNSMNCEVNSHGYQLPFHNQKYLLAQNFVDSYYGDVARASSPLYDFKSCAHDSDYANFSDVDEEDSPPADNTTVAHDSFYTDSQNLEEGRVSRALSF